MSRKTKARKGTRGQPRTAEKKRAKENVEPIQNVLPVLTVPVIALDTSIPKSKTNVVLGKSQSVVEMLCQLIPRLAGNRCNH